MLDTFLATLTPMLTLFICIAVGYIANKTKILPEAKNTNDVHKDSRNGFREGYPCAF